MNKIQRKSEKRKKEKLKEKRELYKAKFETVKRWRNSVVGSTSGSSQTEMKHLNFLIKFCEQIGMNPDDIIQARIQDLMSSDPNIRFRFEDKVLEVSVKFKKEHGYYIARELTTSMISFFSHNRVPLTMTSPKMKDADTYTPTKADIERLYRLANPGWERARISFIYKSGIRRGSIPYIKYGHIKKDLEAGIIPVRIHLRAEEVKGEYFAYDTFIDKQAVEDICLSLEQRKRGTRKIPPEVISDESPLFRKENTKVVEPCDKIAFTSWFVTLSRRAGLSKEETITPQALRRATETTLEEAKMQQNWIDHIMGHRPSGAQGKHYSKPTVEQLRGAYAQAMPYFALELSPCGDTSKAFPAAIVDLKAGNDITNPQTSKSEVLETKPLDKLTNQEIKVLQEKKQQVQQSLSPYLSSWKNQTQPAALQESLNKGSLQRASATGKIAERKGLLNYIS